MIHKIDKTKLENKTKEELINMVVERDWALQYIFAHNLTAIIKENLSLPCSSFEHKEMAMDMLYNMAIERKAEKSLNSYYKRMKMFEEEKELIEFIKLRLAGTNMSLNEDKMNWEWRFCVPDIRNYEGLNNEQNAILSQIEKEWNTTHNNIILILDLYNFEILPKDIE